MFTERFLTFLVTASVIIIVPGPTNLAIVSDSITAGIRKSLWTVLGAAISHAAFIAAATAGLAAVLGSHPRVLVFIKWFGVLYLASQGVRLLLNKSQVRRQQTPPAGAAAVSHLLKGFVVNSTNPKALLFYAALFPPFVDPAMAYVPQLELLSLSFLGIFLLVAGAHALLGQRIRDALNSRRTAALADRVSGSVMIGAAVWMATK